MKTVAAERSSWLLIAVLASTVRLSDDASLSLYDAACEMLDAHEEHAELRSGAVTGSIRNLGSDAAVGALTGPVFEADVIASGSSGRVRFLVTRQGLAAREQNARTGQRASQVV
jgi:hypothetical protein